MTAMVAVAWSKVERPAAERKREVAQRKRPKHRGPETSEHTKCGSLGKAPARVSQVRMRQKWR